MPAVRTLTKVYWFPEKMNAGLLRAFRSSVNDAKVAALIRSPSPSKAGVRYRFTGPTSATLGTTGKLGHIFEGGREGGYPIQPGLKTTRTRAKGVTGVRAGSGAKALKFRDGGFARGTVLGGPMKAKPYIHPAAQLWSHGLYQRRAAAAIRGAIGL